MVGQDKTLEIGIGRGKFRSTSMQGVDDTSEMNIGNVPSNGSAQFRTFRQPRPGVQWEIYQAMRFQRFNKYKSSHKLPPIAVCILSPSLLAYPYQVLTAVPESLVLDFFFLTIDQCVVM